MSVATVFMLGALVEAVRELTDVVVAAIGDDTRNAVTCDKSPSPAAGKEGS